MDLSWWKAHYRPITVNWIISVALLHGKPFTCFVACSDFNLSQGSSTQILKLFSQVLMHHLYQYSLWLRCIELVLHPNFWNYVCIREKCWYANHLLAIFLIFFVIFYMTHLNWLKTGLGVLSLRLRLKYFDLLRYNLIG